MKIDEFPRKYYENIIKIDFANITLYIINFVPEYNDLDKLKMAFQEHKIREGGINFSRIEKSMYKYEYESITQSNDKLFNIVTNCVNFNLLRIFLIFFL